MNVTWFKENAIRSNPDIGLPEFAINAVTSGYCNGTYRYALMPNSYKIDDFSCLEGNLFLSRSIGYNLVQSYIPTGLIVMISWVSFWIDRRAVPARVTLSFTTLVSLTTLGNGLRFGLPQVSYAKAIDLWYGACMLFVFSALLEFAIINSYMRKSEKFDSMAKKMQNGIINDKHLYLVNKYIFVINYKCFSDCTPRSTTKTSFFECKELKQMCNEGKSNGGAFRYIDDVTSGEKENISDSLDYFENMSRPQKA
uniref:Neur_chan_memb domain-containing protein n=1 Tax=Heterorhabditis bacteriophora TaxID=37862 RepID=A0A1I7X405_HETBA